MHASEDHSTRGSLQRTGDDEFNIFSDSSGTLFGDDHRAVGQIPHGLTALFALPHQLDHQTLARNQRGLQRVGEIIDVQQ